MVWAVLRRLKSRASAIAALTVLAVPVVPAAALASTALDRALRGADSALSGLLERSVDRLPVAILLYTAVAAAGLAAAWWREVDRHRREMDTLKTALEALRTTMAADMPQSDGPTALIASVGHRRVPVHPAEIEWVSSAGNYAVIHWRDRERRDQEGLVRETLQSLEARLESARFARGHRSTLINLARVAALRPLADGAWRVTLDSGAELVISRTHRDAFLARLGRCATSQGSGTGTTGSARSGGVTSA